MKTKLEEEVGPMNGVSAKMQRGIVSRLPVANEVQKLCSLAIKKADEWLATNSDVNPNCKGMSNSSSFFLFSLSDLKIF